MNYAILTTQQRNLAFNQALATLRRFRGFTFQKTPGLQGLHVIVYYYLIAVPWKNGTVSRQDILKIAEACGFKATSAIAQMTTKRWLLAIPNVSETLYWINPSLIDKSLTQSYVTSIVNGQPRKVPSLNQFQW